MEKKIVILYEVYPVETYARRYDYQTLNDAGFSIEECDLSPLLSQLHSAAPTAAREDTPQRKYRCFRSREAFRTYIASLGEDAFIWSTFQLTAEYCWIFRLISRRRYGFICNVDYVFPRTASRKKEKSYWTDLSPRRVKNAVLYRLPRRLIPIRKADAVVTYGAGDVQRKLNNVLYDAHTRVELTNTIDYNESIRALKRAEKDSIPGLPEKYVVFVDEYMPYHPDGLRLGLRIDGERYYREVEGFLHRVSALTGMPVVIAAHPKADYTLHAECYRGMKIVQFKTAELLQGAQFVVTHLSIAIGMILACRKPFLLITTDEVSRVIHKGGLTEDQERDLQCRAVNISEELSDEMLQERIAEVQKGMDAAYFDGQIAKYRLPEGHPNEGLSFGDVMIKAMKRVGTDESEKI